ncbi:MAG: sigma 54-interacting transcriptional regulator [Desulfobacterales bacterium]|nr:sigma 54-interacting transcriptional regulator [Desulfobacterales bacterium]
MIAEQLFPSKLITQDPTHGFPLFGPNRILGVSIAILQRFSKDIAEIVDKPTRIQLARRLGRDLGATQASTLSSIHSFSDAREQMRAGSALRTLTGFAHEHLDEVEVRDDGSLVRFTGRWTDAYESTIFIETMKEADNRPARRPVCLSLAAMLSGYASAVFGEPIAVKETTCQAMGAPFCIFEGRPASAWPLQEESLKPSSQRSSRPKNVIPLKTPLKTPELPTTAPARSPAYLAALKRVDKVAPTDATVLISGESGCGKEVVARRIHTLSRRSAEPFLAINCAALPPDLLESELFGHMRGAFTGAERNKKGLLVQAGSGTIFLDEIGDMPLSIQGKLLRAIQQREVRPVGGLEDIPVKARILAATNRPLEEMAAEGRFRQDLYYRLAVFPVHLPPLRERHEDILPIADTILKRLSPEHPGFAPATQKIFMENRWPGNVRELENWVEHGLILAEEAPIEPEHLPHLPKKPVPPKTEDLASDLPTLEELTQRYTNRILKHTKGNRKEAAQILGIGTATLWRHIKKQET